MYKYKQSLGSDICDNILIIQAILGCDTTSRPYGLGKGLGIKKDKKLHFCKQADVFSGTRLSKSDLTEAVEKALVSLYHGREEEGLDALHCRKFCERIKGATHIEPQNLPPTFAASVYHSLRVFFQITQWKGEDVDMNP